MTRTDITVYVGMHFDTYCIGSNHNFFSFALTLHQLSITLIPDFGNIKSIPSHTLGAY